MKKLFLVLLSVSLFSSCDTLNQIYQTPGVGITQAEAGQGIREALSQGVTKGVNFLNVKDGFFGNEAYKLFMPEDAQKVVNTMRQLGMGNLVDKAILQINRAAEDAVGFATPIFVDAIKEMTLADALNIVRGQKDAATEYFKDKTTGKLTAAFLPVIKSSLEKVDATKYYSDLINTYNNFPTTLKKINPDLPTYVTDKAVDALFDRIAIEEANIRENPVARSTEILKKVFGSSLSQQ